MLYMYVVVFTECVDVKHFWEISYTCIFIVCKFYFIFFVEHVSRAVFSRPV